MNNCIVPFIDKEFPITRESIQGAMQLNGLTGSSGVRQSKIIK